MDEEPVALVTALEVDCLLLVVVDIPDVVETINILDDEPDPRDLDEVVDVELGLEGTTKR